MTENNLKCSRCKSTMLPKYLSKNRKGDYFNCRDNCRRNKKDKQILPADKRDEETINRARAEYIQAVIIDSDDTLIYLGPVDPNDDNFLDSKFPKISGDEISIEYHAFENVDTKQTLIFRWSLKLVPNLHESIIIKTSATE